MAKSAAGIRKAVATALVSAGTLALATPAFAAPGGYGGTGSGAAPTPTGVGSNLAVKTLKATGGNVQAKSSGAILGVFVPNGSFSRPTTVVTKKITPVMLHEALGKDAGGPTIVAAFGVVPETKYGNATSARRPFVIVIRDKAIKKGDRLYIYFGTKLIWIRNAYVRNGVVAIPSKRAEDVVVRA